MFVLSTADHEAAIATLDVAVPGSRPIVNFVIGLIKNTIASLGPALSPQLDALVKQLADAAIDGFAATLPGGAGAAALIKIVVNSIIDKVLLPTPVVVPTPAPAAAA